MDASVSRRSGVQRVQGALDAPIAYKPGLCIIMPPSAKIVVAVM